MINLEGFEIEKQVDMIEKLSNKTKSDNAIDFFLSNDFKSEFSKNNIINELSEKVYTQMLQSNDMKFTHSNLQIFDYDSYKSLAFVDDRDNTLVELSVAPGSSLYPRRNDPVVLITYRETSSEIFSDFKEASQHFKEYTNEFMHVMRNEMKKAFENDNELKHNVNQKLSHKFSM
ncbi:hypothetical protein ACPUEX_22530 [Enterobacter vonholyi]